MGNFPTIPWREQVTYLMWCWCDDDVRFVPDQLKQQSNGTQVAPFGHIILIPSQPISFFNKLKKCQIYSIWFDSTSTQNQDLPLSRKAH